MERTYCKKDVEEVFSKHYRCMLKNVRGVIGDGYLAEDAVHDAFVYVIKGLIKNPDMFSGQSERKLVSYLYKTVRNMAVDICRKRRDVVTEPGSRVFEKWKNLHYGGGGRGYSATAPSGLQATVGSEICMRLY